MRQEANPSLQQQLADYYRAVLQIQRGPKITCHAVTKKKEPCKNPASRDDVASIPSLLDKLVRLSASDAGDAGELLNGLLRATLCHLHHKDEGQCQTLRKKWTYNLQKAGPGKAAPQKAPQGTERKEPALSGVDAGETKKEEEESQDQPLHDIPHVSGTASPKAKKGVRSKQCSSSAPVHHFEPFGEPRTRRKTNCLLKKLILSDLTQTDLKDYHKPGNIYTYTFPSTYRDEKPLIKIGNAHDVTKRLDSWRRQCGYQPEELSRFSAQLHVRVERLVHIQLYEFRMREKKCPQCGIQHVEWFDLSSSDVAGAVALWADWTRRAPYHADGKLKEEWRRKLDLVDLDDESCWKKFVNGA